MDREKRRSEEEEAQLDKKIALIREKNMKIVERTKEIEKDRIEAGESSRPLSANSTGKKRVDHRRTNRAGKQSWHREWDRGKTPVETWRENVPSMESLDGLQSKRGKGKGGRRGEGRGAEKVREGEKDAAHWNGSARLAGRVTRMGGEDGIDTDEAKPATRRGPRRAKVPEENKEPLENEGDYMHISKDAKHHRPLPRRENEKYVIRQLMRKIVDRVVGKEKREGRLEDGGEKGVEESIEKGEKEQGKKRKEGEKGACADKREEGVEEVESKLIVEKEKKKEEAEEGSVKNPKQHEEAEVNTAADLQQTVEVSENHEGKVIEASPPEDFICTETKVHEPEKKEREAEVTLEKGEDIVMSPRGKGTSENSPRKHILDIAEQSIERSGETNNNVDSSEVTAPSQDTQTKIKAEDAGDVVQTVVNLKGDSFAVPTQSLLQ